ncbi:hypothetical protein BURMUCF1_0908 [Burkholderia multivorans ATCC BAA-247]|nr:hypothetical protein BURMUCF1_0908 [Burkholderia multivorans ATCC BAA-247]
MKHTAKSAKHRAGSTNSKVGDAATEGAGVQGGASAGAGSQ